MALARKIFEEITYFGGLGFYLLLVVLFFLLGMADASLKLILGLAVIYLVTLAVRLFYFRPRPNKESHSNLLEKLDASSFPSVHAARITLISLFVIFSFFPNITYVALIFALWALTLYSRIYLKKHYLSDIIAGVILGSLTFLLLFFI